MTYINYYPNFVTASDKSIMNLHRLELFCRLTVFINRYICKSVKIDFADRFVSLRYAPAYHLQQNPLLMPVSADGDYLLTTGKRLLTTGNCLLTAGNCLLTTGNRLLTTGNCLLTTGIHLLRSGNCLQSTGNRLLSGGSCMMGDKLPSVCLMP